MRSDVLYYIYRGRRAGATAAGLVLALGLGAPGVVAQTRFEWPDTTVDVAAYTTPDLCLAAVDRVRSGLWRREELTVWHDTMPVDLQRGLKPEPAPVTEAARRCAARFAEATADLGDFEPLMTLYLAAGRDADAAALLTRRLAALPATDGRARTAVGDTAIRAYLQAHPARLAAAEEILDQRARRSDSRIRRLTIYYEMMQAASGAGDTARDRRAARRVVAIGDSLTTEERRSEEYEKLADGNGGDLLLFTAMDHLTGLSTLLDSLRHSTASLAALERHIFAWATRQRPEALDLPVGERAPAITATYWYPRDAGKSPHPTPGHVTLIAFFDAGSCMNDDADADASLLGTCVADLAILRRLSERFPTLDITFVARTRGHFMAAAPPDTANEASMIEQFLQPFGVQRATLAVTATPFWRLESPDDRRIDRDVPNVTAYRFGKTVKVGSGSLYLVDQDGIIVDNWHRSESALSQLIDVLMHRHGEVGDHAAR
jgi:hypothetical protein